MGDTDELSPSVTSDEQMIYFIRLVSANPKDKKSPATQSICNAVCQNGTWQAATPILITGDADADPVILEDNRTLLFQRKEEDGNRWQMYHAERKDDHNWTLPDLVTDPIQPSPVLCVSGVITATRSGSIIPFGRVYVYDTYTQQLLQTARVNSVTGRWQVALQKDRQYHLDITADGYSHRYMDYNTTALRQRQRIDLGALVLDDRLQLRVHCYDGETQERIDEKPFTLPLGQIHKLTIGSNGFLDTVMEVNTLRPMVYTETELDILLRPKKSVHHFKVYNVKTRKNIPNPILRLEGQLVQRDTALRIEQRLNLQVSAPGYLLGDTLFHTGTDMRQRTVSVGLRPIEKDMVLQMRNIQFEYNSYELTLESNTELEKVAQLLLLNPTLRIELSAHTDDQGANWYNERLSAKRGKAVREWLIRRGIAAERLESVGYGKRKPLVPNTSAKNRAINRRVEIKILDY